MAEFYDIRAIPDSEKNPYIIINEKHLGKIHSVRRTLEFFEKLFETADIAFTSGSIDGDHRKILKARILSRMNLKLKEVIHDE